MDDETLRTRAAERLARIELNGIEADRDIADLLRQGRVSDEVSRLVGVDSERIQLVKARVALGESFDGETPREIVVRAVVLRTERRELVERLKAIAYTFGEDAPCPFEGASSGTWDEVADAYFEGWLTREEYGEIHDAAGADADHCDRSPPVRD